MWKPQAPRSKTTLAIWGAATVAFLGLVLWHFGWLPIGLETPESGTLVKKGRSGPGGAGSEGASGAELGSGTTSVPPDGFGVYDEQADLGAAEPSVIEAQSEPPVQEGEPDDSRNFGEAQQRTSASDPLAEVLFPQPAETDADATDSDGMPLPDRERPHRFSFDRQNGPGGDGESHVPPEEDPEVRGNGEFLPAAPNGRAGSGRDYPNESPIRRVAAEEERQKSVPPEVKEKLAEIDALLTDGKDLVAHRELSTLYWVRPDWRPFLRDRVEETAQRIYFSPQPHYMDPYVVQPGDQLRNVARQYKVPWQYLVRLNRIQPREIRPGQKLKVIKGPFSARIDLSDFEMTIHAWGYFVRRYPIGIGRDGTTPIGKFTVKLKEVNPVYYGPEGIVGRDDPKNPLGERWIDIGDSYGIHGTIEPDSIGKAESRGCIRLYNSDIEEAFDLLSVGSEVVIRR